MPSQPIPFPLYAADFYMDTISWDNYEIGMYFRLLMAEWVHGPLPSEYKKLQKICQVGSKKWQNNWKIVGEKFELNDDGKIINQRLEEIREELAEHKEEQTQENSSMSVQSTKIGADIDRACDYLCENEIFPEAREWKDEMLEQGKNERILMHALMKCAIEIKSGMSGMSAQEFCMEIIEKVEEE